MVFNGGRLEKYGKGMIEPIHPTWYKKYEGLVCEKTDRDNSASMKSLRESYERMQFYHFHKEGHLVDKHWHPHSYQICGLKIHGKK